MTMRIGFGYDVHAFTPGRPLVLGGVTIPYTFGLSGHSDADTVIHAVVDALLGAAALGDIGLHFPSSDPRWENQPGSVFLDYTFDLLCQHQWKISNIDATIVAEQPRLAPHVQSMRTHLAKHSVFAAMIKSLRCSPPILCVHHVTVVLPHSVKRAG